MTAATPKSENHPLLLTLLGPAISDLDQQRVRAILSAHDLEVSNADQLTASLAPTEEPFNAVLQFTLEGSPKEEKALRAELLIAATDLSLDIALQHDTPHRTTRRLFVFDMDSTLIQGEVIDELAKLAGVGEQVSKITEAAMRGELNFDESFTRRVGLLKGLPAEHAHSLLDRIPLSPGAERLFRTLKSLGYYTAILSGGFTFFAESLQARLGIDEFHANELEIMDGKVTGRVIPPIMNGARKAAMLQQIAERQNIPLEEAVAVGDGANDLPMMQLAGMGIAYRAKPIVRAQADHSITSLGLDGLLYLIGLSDQDLHPDSAPHPSSAK
jgi:phosphoserine phosphatase